MRLELSPNPLTPRDATRSIAVEVERLGPEAIALRYQLVGELAALVVPAVAAPGRADELWRHTCFEAFLRPDADEGYCEFNFAPSTQWAAYRFTGYREGMAPAPVAPPRIDVRAGDGVLLLTAKLNLAGLDLCSGASRLALSAVVEEASGAKSYWALAHPPGKPDFHHRSSFACTLAGQEGS